MESEFLGLSGEKQELGCKDDDFRQAAGGRHEQRFGHEQGPPRQQDLTAAEDEKIVKKVNWILIVWRGLETYLQVAASGLLRGLAEC